MKRLLLLVVLSVIALLMFVPTATAQDAGVESVPIQNAWSVNIGDNFFDPPNAAVEPGISRPASTSTDVCVASQSHRSCGVN